MARPLCTVEGCFKTINARGLCPQHYWRLTTNGSLELKPRTTSATEGNFWDYVRMQVDHMCHNRNCVRLEHLRLATNKQNTENPSKLSTLNTSGYRGVYWNEAMQKWHARVTHNYKRYHLGFFVNLEDANQAAIAARNELFTHNILDRINA